MRRGESVRRNGVETIGILGLQPGCGTTHLALMTAGYLHNYVNSRSIYLEVNDSAEIGMLKSVKKTDSSTKGEKKDFFYQKIHIYEHVTAQMLPSILQVENGASVLDFGVPGVRMRGEFFRCSRRIVISDGSILRSTPLLQWLMRYPQNQFGYDLLIRFPDSVVLRQLKDSNTVWHKVAEDPDPFNPGLSNLLLLKELFL